MKKTKKAALAVSAAIAAGGLVAAKAVAGAPKDSKSSPDAGVAQQDAPQGESKKNVVKVKKASPPTGESDYGLAMPAGTLYDVLSRDDVP